jgi:hypothetical protein
LPFIPNSTSLPPTLSNPNHPTSNNLHHNSPPVPPPPPCRRRRHPSFQQQVSKQNLY